MVLLIVPPKITSLDRDVGMNQQSVPSGLAYIAGYLRSKGVEVSIVDAQAERIDLAVLAQRVMKINPDIVGISVHCSVQISEAHAAAKAIKKINNNIKIIIGGAHPSAIPKETLESLESFDFIVCGEGEVTMHELVKSLRDAAPYDDLPGIAYRKAGVARINSPRRYIENLDELPFPAFELFKLDKYKPHFQSRRNTLELPVTTIRGCPSKCFFCYQPMSDYVRMRSVKNVIEEIKYCVEHFGMSQILFTDDTFTLYPQRIDDFCNSAISEGLNSKVNWLCASRVDIVNKDLLAKMKQAGCSCITYGIESGNQGILNGIKKNITLKQAQDAISWTKEAGIKADANFIIGLPDETQDTIKDTIKFMIELDPDFVNVAILAIFPGTKAMQMATQGQGGIRLLNNDWQRSGRIVGNMVELSNLSRKRLESLQTLAYMKFYLRPKKLGNLFKKINFKTLYNYTVHQICNKINI